MFKEDIYGYVRNYISSCTHPNSICLYFDFDSLVWACQTLDIGVLIYANCNRTCMTFWFCIEFTFWIAKNVGLLINFPVDRVHVYGKKLGTFSVVSKREFVSLLLFWWVFLSSAIGETKTNRAKRDPFLYNHLASNLLLKCLGQKRIPRTSI